MSGLPSGTVTLLFTDIEGSTKLVQSLGDAYPPLLEEHRRLLVGAIEAEGGQPFGTEGDAVFAVFGSAAAAVRAAASAQRALGEHGWPEGATVRVRMGIHSGEVALSGDSYVGLALHQVARVMSAGHGGQVLVSGSTHELVGEAPASGLRLIDLGEHRLKDLAEPMRLFQLAGPGLASEFAALRTIDARPNNLPVQLTTFVGRAELEAARRSLAETRLLTLTGPGGMGKTRLALELAADALPDFPHGTWFVPLETVHEAELLASAIADAIRLPEAPGRPPLESLIEYLRPRQLLLVLDNFEQLVEGAPLVAQLLREAPGLKVVVTSRILLRVYGERELAVPPMALPQPAGRDGRIDAATAAASEAVALFVERARAARPEFVLSDDNAAAVVEIVSRLDGLPLAIELAAARARILPVENIRARLDQKLALLTGGSRDLPARQQTLRGAIDWSYEMLEPAERALFERFSVFAGGAFLAEADQVCGPASEVGIDVLDGLSSLADKSLLRAIVADVPEPRFAMLATIREYAAERLATGGSTAEIRERHARAYAGVVDSCAPLLTGDQGPSLNDRLQVDHDNLRAALDWAVESRATALALGLIAGLWRFWQTRGHLHEARARVAQVLALPGVDDQPPDLRARAYAAGGGVDYWMGRFDAAYVHYTRALEAARESGDRAAIALAMYNLGFAAEPKVTLTQDERYRAGRPWFEQALAAYTELGDEKGVADAEWALALAAAAERDLDGAREHSERALEYYRRLGEDFGIGWAAHMLSLYWLAESRLDEAVAFAAESLNTFRTMRDVSGMVLATYDFAMIADRAGEQERAARLAGAVESLGESTGMGVIGEGFEFLGWHAPRRPSQPDLLAAWEDGAGWDVERAAAYALESAREGAAREPAASS
jgi:predicted ATPase/class 3 adenylate cyclase